MLRKGIKTYAQEPDRMNFMSYMMTLGTADDSRQQVFLVSVPIDMSCNATNKEQFHVSSPTGTVPLCVVQTVVFVKLELPVSASE